MYLFPEWDALKSVKYISTSHVNHERTRRSAARAPGDAACHAIFRMIIKDLVCC